MDYENEELVNEELVDIGDKTDPMEEPLSEMDVDDISQSVVKRGLPKYADVFGEIMAKKKVIGYCDKKVMNEIIRDVAKWLIGIWKNMGIPIRDVDRVEEAVRKLTKTRRPKYLNEICNIAKCGHYGRAKTIEKISKYSKLIIIYILNFTISIFVLICITDSVVCDCKDEDRIPVDKLHLLATPTDPSEVIGGSGTENDSAFFDTTVDNNDMADTTTGMDSDSEGSLVDEQNGPEADEWLPSMKSQKVPKVQKVVIRNRLNYPLLSSIMGRCGVSFESGFKILNAYVNDILPHLPKEMQQILNNHRVSKTKLKNMSLGNFAELLEQHLKSGPYPVVGIDGKMGPVRMENGRLISKDKQTIVDQVTGLLVDFIILEKKNVTAIVISTELYKILEKYGSLDDLLALSVDNENKNTGRNHGIIRLMELQLGRPLTWICCILHEMEVVFRHIFEEVDGKASGPQSYTGKIGKIISAKDDSWKTKSFMKNFEAREGLVEETDYKYANNDIQLLYLFCMLVQKGPNSKYRDILFKFIGENKFAINRIPGLISLARWITTATNILCLYVTTDPIEYGEDYDKLVFMVDVIIRFYFVIIDRIHKNSHVSNGSKLFHEAMTLARDVLDDENWEKSEKVFLNNAYWAVYESIILAMSKDEDIKKRKVAAQEIKDAWERRQATIKAILKRCPNEEKPETKMKVRKFEILEKLIDTKADDYSKMLPFDKLGSRQKTIPPLILDSVKKLGIKEVVRLIIDGSLPMVDVPCHSQAVERNVKLNSEACEAVSGKENQLGWALNKQKSCKEFKTQETKQKFLDLDKM